MMDMTISEITNLIRNREEASPDEIKKWFDSIYGLIVVPSLTIEAGTTLYRATVITSEEEMSCITCISRLSYKPAYLNSTYGRASTPHNTMFYGIVSSNIQNAHYSCLVETCPIFREKKQEQGHYRVAIGKWILKKELRMAAIVDVDGNNKSGALRNFDPKDFIRIIDQLNNYQEVIDFWRLINQEFRKNVAKDREYAVSAHFAEKLLSKGFDGIIYESIQSIDEKAKESLCVAVRPEIVDNHFLDIESMVLYEFDYKGNNTPVTPQKTMHHIFNPTE